MSRANLFIPLLYLIYIGVVLVIGEGWFLWIVCVVVVGGVGYSGGEVSPSSVQFWLKFVCLF